VGGGVRDLLLKKRPKDFDIATDASPEEVNALFRNCRLIGRRFRLAHVHFGREIIEVATFRAQHQDAPTNNSQKKPDLSSAGVMQDGRILRDNVYGTLEDDALRRDFTVNALYYNIADFSLVDYSGGLDDLRAGLLRLIGDPEKRYREDPVRMLRAIRFAAKLGLTIDPPSADPIPKMGHLLHDISPSRLYEEMLKLFLSGHAENSFNGLKDFNLLSAMLPVTHQFIDDENAMALVQSALKNTDLRVKQHKPVAPSFLIAVLLWPAMWKQMEEAQAADADLPLQEALFNACYSVSKQQNKHVAIPKRIMLQVREIWQVQCRMIRMQGQRRALQILSHKRLRAAYDFLLLRAESDDSVSEAKEWWFEVMATPENEHDGLFPDNQPQRKRRKRKPKPKPPED
jgi:poly(A) polymerase